MRKTISVLWLIEHVNEFNRTSENEWEAERDGKNRMLEMVLHETGNYCGFQYLSEDQVAGKDLTVGIREQKEDGTWNFDNTDRTRAKYYINHKL